MGTVSYFRRHVTVRLECVLNLYERASAIPLRTRSEARKQTNAAPKHTQNNPSNNCNPSADIQDYRNKEMVAVLEVVRKSTSPNHALQRTATWRSVTDARL